MFFLYLSDYHIYVSNFCLISTSNIGDIVSVRFIITYKYKINNQFETNAF